MRKRSPVVRVKTVLIVCFLLLGCSEDMAVKTDVAQIVLPDGNSPGAKLLKKYCSNCHGAPHPAVHKKDEWSNVVYRMNLRRIKRALGGVPEQEKPVLISYLEMYASK